MSVLVIGDLHLPATHRRYLGFCKTAARRYRCKRVVFIGDIFDFHMFSRYQKNLSMAPAGEVDACRASVRPWVEAFPDATVTLGNHDDRLARRVIEAGIPAQMLRSFHDLFKLRRWRLLPPGQRLLHKRVCYFHGEGFGGQQGYVKAAQTHLMSTVIGHHHSYAGCAPIAGPKSLIWGMNVGCGVDCNHPAMDYAVNSARKSIVSCGVVESAGQFHLLTMPMGKDCKEQQK